MKQQGVLVTNDVTIEIDMTFYFESIERDKVVLNKGTVILTR